MRLLEKIKNPLLYERRLKYRVGMIKTIQAFPASPLRRSPVDKPLSEREGLRRA